MIGIFIPQGTAQEIKKSRSREIDTLTEEVTEVVGEITEVVGEVTEVVGGVTEVVGEASEEEVAEEEKIGGKMEENLEEGVGRLGGQRVETGRQKSGTGVMEGGHQLPGRV